MMVLWVTLALAGPSEDLTRELTARHASHPCSEMVEEYGVDAMIEAAEQVVAPAWAPMRAATCVGEAVHGGGEAAVLRWLADPAVPGLAAAAVAGLEGAEVPPRAVVEALSVRLNGDERFARTLRLERSAHLELRALGR